MRNRLKGALAHAVLLVFAATALFPLLLVVLNSFKTNAGVTGSPFALPKSFSLSNFETARAYSKSF